MQPNGNRFGVTTDRELFQAIVAAHAAAIVVSAVRALLDGGAIVLPSGVSPDAVQVTADPSEPTRLTLSVGEQSTTFPVDVQADDALAELPGLLGREAERAVIHLNEIHDGIEGGHLQW